MLREFCGTCGSPIRSIPTATPAIVAIKVGTLDHPEPYSPYLDVLGRELGGYRYQCNPL